MSTDTVGDAGRIVKPSGKPLSPKALSPSEKIRKETAEKKDVHSLMKNEGFAVSDQSEKMLQGPEFVTSCYGPDFTVAKNPPHISFAVIPYGNRYFPETNEDKKYGPWSSWGQGCFDSARNKFYGAVGDHGWYDPNLHVIEYDTEKNQVACLAEINDLLRRKPDEFGEAKIHGYPDIYKASYQEHEHLWFCTYWCRYPEPLDHDFATGYSGGHIMSYDLDTKTFVDYGVPLERASWPYHRIDTKHGMLYAIGMFGEFLAWDINAQKIKWAGYPPPTMKWYNRCLLLDEESGMVYTNNMLSSDLTIMKYDPFKNRFFETPAKMPVEKTYKTVVPIRCHTRKRDPNGKYWGLMALGNLFSFDPVSETLEVSENKLWPLNDAYSVTMDMSPGGRYLYFGIASHGRGYPYGSPVLQYDLIDKKLKVLAYLYPYYYEKYGYIAGGSYAFKLDDAGEKLYMIWNGDFNNVETLFENHKHYDSDLIDNWSKPSPHDAFGHCAIFVLTIPAQERVE